ncbi:large ribosomal subunit protein mL49-like [Littorina saxatilis]|uniref:Large ribosomal subunit protein mL49 n=1 Tax=Littorina saxatilis TaxID=31220 RepID=A0AAN9BE43_9CAEN
MASSRLLKGVCLACRFSLTNQLQKRVAASTSLPITQIRLKHRSALPPAAEIPEEDLADYEMSSEEFKYVERILPSKTVPPVPHHDSYPTPSGWVPPKESAKSLPYYVRRTKNHMLPIYEEVRNGDTRKLVMIKHIDGDIWAFDADLKAHLQEVTTRKVIATQVHEMGGYLRVKGLVAEEVCQFLLDKGF